MITTGDNEDLMEKKVDEVIVMCQLHKVNQKRGAGEIKEGNILGSIMKEGVVESGEASAIIATPKRGLNRGISIADLILRGFAAIGTFGSAMTMGTTNETLAIITQPLIRARYNDLPSLTFFVIANSIVCGYLVLSIPLSIFHFIRSEAKITRIILVIFDTAMVELLTAAASAATVVAYLAHKGNVNANWLAICQQFDNFCERISGSLLGSFASITMITLIIFASAVVLSWS